MTAVGAAIAGIVAVAASLTAIIDWVDQRIGPEPVVTPRAIDARVSSVSLRSPRQPLGDYLREIGEPVAGYTRNQLRERGLTFRTRLSAKGAVGTRLLLVWRLYDVDRETPVPGDDYRQVAADFKTEAATQRRTWPIWVPYPPAPGRYRLDVTFQDAKRQPVDERSSPAFTIGKVPNLD